MLLEDLVSLNSNFAKEFPTLHRVMKDFNLDLGQVFLLDFVVQNQNLRLESYEKSFSIDGVFVTMFLCDKVTITLGGKSVSVLRYKPLCSDLSADLEKFCNIEKISFNFYNVNKNEELVVSNNEFVNVLPDKNSPTNYDSETANEDVGSDTLPDSKKVVKKSNSDHDSFTPYRTLIRELAKNGLEVNGHKDKPLGYSILGNSVSTAASYNSFCARNCITVKDNSQVISMILKYYKSIEYPKGLKKFFDDVADVSWEHIKKTSDNSSFLSGFTWDD